MSTTTRARVTLAIAAAGALAAVAVPWFSRDEDQGDTQTSLRWGLVWSSHCSDFARPAVECRYEVFDLEPDWTLVPLFVITRFLALGAALALAVVAARSWAGRERSPAVARVGGVALLVFAVHLAALPGDMQYEEMQWSWGAWLALAAAACAALGDLPARRANLAPAVGAVLALCAALWLPWVVEVEAWFPRDPEEQSAYGWGTLARWHHWHSLRSPRRHYVEDAVSWEELADLRTRDLVEHGPPIAAAVAGVALAASLLIVARAGDGSRTRTIRLASCAAMVAGGATIPFLARTHGGILPGAGALCAIVVLAGVVAAEVSRARALSTRP